MADGRVGTGCMNMIPFLRIFFYVFEALALVVYQILIILTYKRISFFYLLFNKVRRE